MSKGYRPYLPNQDLLLPPSLQEWLPEGHLVYFVSDVVNQLDLSAVHAVYGEERSEERRVRKECRSRWSPYLSSRRRHTRCLSDWSSDVCSSDLLKVIWSTS